VAFGLAAVLDELARHRRDLAALRGGHRCCTSGSPPSVDLRATALSDEDMA
jgi:hypothetical protein